MTRRYQNRAWWGWSISGRQMRIILCPFAPPSVLPDISPSRGEIGCHYRFREPSKLQKKSRQCGRLNLPLEGEMSGRTEGGVQGQRTTRDTEEDKELSKR
jgi:hypothetical protein